MKLHNTLTRKIEEFKPLDGTVRMYACGPTVYDHAHIGNLSAYVMVDTLRRVLTANGYELKVVMNFTDVDDKTIRRSQELYPDLVPEEALQKLTRQYEEVFLSDMQAIGIDTTAYTFVRATESIEGMRALITDLYNDGFAYITDDGVYFSIEKYRASGKKYGQLSKISAGNTSEARIDNDEYDKESVHDFALWKTRKDNEPAWDFELDGHDLTGRPGWHIECSVMSVNNLGMPFDIHTGGVDHIFPHHENEIAQSTAGRGDIYANFFVHNEHLLVDGKKMAKSYNNFFTLQDIRERGYDPLAFRLMILQSHYRNQSNFTWDNLEAAQNRLHNWQAAFDTRWQISDDPTSTGDEPKVEAINKRITDALQNNLGTPEAIAAVENMISLIENRGLSADLLPGVNETVQIVIDQLGIDIIDRDISKEQKDILAQRQKARDDKDFAESDRLRDQLKEQGIGVRDTAHGQIWNRL